MKVKLTQNGRQIGQAELLDIDSAASDRVIEHCLRIVYPQGLITAPWGSKRHPCGDWVVDLAGES